MQTIGRVAAAAILAAVSSIATAQEAENPSVAARQHHMNLYAFNLGQLGAMAKGEMPYDAALATAAADNLAALAGLTQAAYWPEGTAMGEVEGSAALPVLFTELDNYQELTGDLQQAAVAMQEAAGTSAEAIGGQMQALGGACGACHRIYRARDE